MTWAFARKPHVKSETQNQTYFTFPFHFSTCTIDNVFSSEQQNKIQIEDYFVGDMTMS